MMDCETLLPLVERVARLGSLACEGCGHEHNCQAEGCAILREAMAQMQQLHRDVRGSCRSCVHTDVSANDKPCLSCDFIERQNWQWRGVVEVRQ
ncbi:MAG: hypothetical protein LUC48_09720 [Clostridiales bacterium]|nr:hypothetical protein [Clostridiales bacterium]